MKTEDLIREAFQARKNAYAAYSGFTVGAALLAKNGTVFHGCNIENASYGATMCAERTAVFSAVAAGVHGFSAIAIVGGREMDEAEVSDYAYPCGICRQVLSEFCLPDFKVIVAKSETEYKEFALKELLPEGFVLHKDIMDDPER